MTETKPVKPDVRFEVAIAEENFGGGDWYVKFTARALAWGQSTIDEKFDLYTPDSYELPYGTRPSELKGLVITAQSDRDHMRRAGEEFYGWHVGIDRSPHVIELRDAEEIVKALRKISRGMDKLAQEMGRPATLAQFAVHAARALTAERSPFVRWVRGEDDWDGTGRRWMDANDLSGWLWRECAELRKKHGIETAE